jgi:hypothetical protein
VWETHSTAAFVNPISYYTETAAKKQLKFYARDWSCVLAAASRKTDKNGSHPFGIHTI